MNMDGIDWVFDTSREETIPKGGFLCWCIKRWVIGGILFVLATMAGVVTVLIGAKDFEPEFVCGLTLGAFILVFCVFLVWMTYRRARRRKRKQESEDMALLHEIAQYYREKRQ